MNKELTAIFATLEEDYQAATRRLARAKNILLQARKAIRHGRRWKDVRQERLRIGTTYFVRRTFGNSPANMPALAVWTENGWMTLWGHIATTTISAAGLQVWA